MNKRKKNRPSNTVREFLGNRHQNLPLCADSLWRWKKAARSNLDIFLPTAKHKASLATAHTGTVLGGDDEAKSSAKESWNWEYQLAASLMGFGLVNPPRVPNGLGVLRCASASAVENIHNWFILGGVDISSTTVYAGTRLAWDGYIGP